MVSTKVLNNVNLEKELARLDNVELQETIEHFETTYMPMRISGIKDKDGFDTVHRSFITVRDKLLEVESIRKALKRDALDYGNAVDAAARVIRERLEPVKQHLYDERQRIRDEKEAIKFAEKAKKEIEACWDEAHRTNDELDLAIWWKMRKHADMDNADFDRERIEQERKKLAEEKRIAEAAEKARQKGFNEGFKAAKESPVDDPQKEVDKLSDALAANHAKLLASHISRNDIAPGAQLDKQNIAASAVSNNELVTSTKTDTAPGIGGTIDEVVADAAGMMPLEQDRSAVMWWLRSFMDIKPPSVTDSELNQFVISIQNSIHQNVAEAIKAVDAYEPKA